jgi:peptidoglycan/xylan/chitin deacetylase (PgdA/CDA1 family)
MRKIALWTTALFITATAAGCGTASASTTPRWHAAGSAPPSAVAASRSTGVQHSDKPSATPAEATTTTTTTAETTTAPTTAVPTHAPAATPEDVPVAAVSSRPTPPRTNPSVQPAKRTHGGGPAGSLMQTGTSSVALSFDDGPDPVQTPALLDLLAQNHVKATFCVVGVHVREHPDLVRRIAHDGHTLCNHSWNHSLTLGTGTPDAITADLARTNAAIRAAVPDARIPYFRAPGGNFTEPLAAAAAGLGMRSIYWDLDPRDWDHTTDGSDQAHRNRVVSEVRHQVRKGSIVLSHDYEQPQTVKAYRTLLPWLKQRYTLIALP